MRTSLNFKFVEFIPPLMEEGVLYITVEYKAAAHLCACGCGKKVITSITPTGWNITYDGETISISPSIGNWSFECKSHYWVRKNQIIEAPDWDQDRIEYFRKEDTKKKLKFFNKKKKD